jgi:hypothetical protein
MKYKFFVRGGFFKKAEYFLEDESNTTVFKACQENLKKKSFSDWFRSYNFKINIFQNDKKVGEMNIDAGSRNGKLHLIFTNDKNQESHAVHKNATVFILDKNNRENGVIPYLPNKKQILVFSESESYTVENKMGLSIQTQVTSNIQNTTDKTNLAFLFACLSMKEIINQIHSTSTLTTGIV